MTPVRGRFSVSSAWAPARATGPGQGRKPMKATIHRWRFAAWRIAAIAAIALAVGAGPGVWAQPDDDDDDDGDRRSSRLVDLGRPHFSPARTPAHEDIPKG